MARMLRWLLVLTVLVAAAAVVASADGWIPSFGQKTDQDKAKDGATQAVDGAKSWTNWAAERIPYVSRTTAKQASDKLDASKDTAANVAGEGEKKTRTTAETAREYAAKSLERMTSTKDQLHGATTGFIQKWGSWAKDNVGKYYSYGPLAQKATDTVKDTASDVDSAADSAKENLETAKEEVQRQTDEKEL